MQDQSAETRPPRGDYVSLTLMNGEEADAAVEMLTAHIPDLIVKRRDSYVRIEAPHGISVDMQALSEHLGRPLDSAGFLVVMSAFTGRIDVRPEVIDLYTEIAPAALTPE